MARTDAISIFQSNGATADKLREVYASIVDQIQKGALSVALKNQELSGNPLAGSVEVRRLMTATVRNYGTARTAGEGDQVKNNGVTINLDQRKEIVEEINNFDVEQYGLDGMLARRSQNFSLGAIRHLDSAFFTIAESAGTEVTLTGSTLVEKIEQLIQSVETVSNDNVDGVDRELLDLVLTPEVYGLLESYIDTLPNPMSGGVDVKLFHRVRVHSNVRQTEDAICMVRGSIGQPVAMVDFQVAPIDLSNETAMAMFFNYGTKAVMADLIKFGTVTGS